MDNGVLHQRLDQQAGNAAIHLFINIIDNRQLVAKAGLLNGNIVFNLGNDSNLLIVFYVQIMPDDLVMQLHRF
ncbi:hypothetical protein CBL21_07870 [Shigella flexneri]|nr:hypothetical protein CBL21_07870 [Shigella flexneri]